MLEMDRQKYIKNLEQYERMSLRSIAKKTGHHIQTVKKYVEKEDWNAEYKMRKEQATKLSALHEVIDGWLREDMKRPRKYRRTASKIYRDLAADGEYSRQLTVCKQSVINYVRKRKKEISKQTYDTAMFAIHAMSEAQVDFGDILVKRSHGGEEVWHELVVSFPFSNAGFAQVCRYETKECLCEALIGIFKYIGGVPVRILFDNMSSAVVHIEEHGNRKMTEMFTRFTMHHRFKAEFCNPDSPHES